MTAKKSSGVSLVPPDCALIRAARKDSRDLRQFAGGSAVPCDENGSFLPSQAAKSRRSTLIGKRTAAPRCSSGRLVIASPSFRSFIR